VYDQLAQVGYQNSPELNSRYANAVYAVVVCRSVCVCLSNSDIVPKQLNVGSRK